MWALYMTLGAGLYRAVQVCLVAMRENDQRDVEDESWQSVMDIQ